MGWKRVTLLGIVPAVLAGVAMSSPAGAPVRQPQVRQPPVLQPPVLHGPNAAPVLADIGDAGARLTRLNSLLVSWRGNQMLERYFNRTRADRPTNMKSASKSLVSALVGIAIDRKLIAGVMKQSTRSFLSFSRRKRTRASAISPIEDLLTMRSGLETTSNRNYGAWVRSPNWVRLRAAPAARERPWHLDGIQHGQHASAVSDPHQSHP